MLGKRPIINRNKYEWETFNTPKIKTVYATAHAFGGNDYGTKLRIKCHQRIERKEKTIGGELCMNWELIDNFGVRLDFTDNDYYDNNDNNDVYKKFYNRIIGISSRLDNGLDKMFTFVKNC